MKTSRAIKLILALAASATAGAFASGHEGQAPDKTQTETAASVLKVEDAGISGDWLARARTEYPLDTCAVSGDRFDGGDMGKPQDYVYRQEGKPDRLLRFCCKDCVNDFSKDPPQYLKVIDEAASKKQNAIK